MLETCLHCHHFILKKEDPFLFGSDGKCKNTLGNKKTHSYGTCPFFSNVHESPSPKESLNSINSMATGEISAE